MKKLISFTSLIIFFLILISSGCKKDEEVVTKTPEELLIGTWDVSYFAQVTYLNGVKYEGSETIDLIAPGEMTLKILDDGTGEEWENGDLIDTFTWVLNGDIITVTVAGEVPMVMPMTFTVTDTRLLLIGSITTTVAPDTYVYTQTIIASRATD
jgi:hypothetical protein